MDAFRVAFRWSCVWIASAFGCLELDLHVHWNCIWMELRLQMHAGGVAFGCICIWSSDAFGLQCHPRASTHLIGSRSGVPMHGGAVRSQGTCVFWKCVSKGRFFSGDAREGMHFVGRDLKGVRLSLSLSLSLQIVFKSEC